MSEMPQQPLQKGVLSTDTRKGSTTGPGHCSARTARHVALRDRCFFDDRLDADGTGLRYEWRYKSHWYLATL